MKLDLGYDVTAQIIDGRVLLHAPSEMGIHTTIVERSQWFKLLDFVQSAGVFQPRTLANQEQPMTPKEQIEEQYAYARGEEPGMTPFSYPDLTPPPGGLYMRYVVSKADGSPVDPRAFYFVLRLDDYGDDPTWTECCQIAARALVDALRAKGHLPKVADDLEALLPAPPPRTITGDGQPLPSGVWGRQVLSAGPGDRSMVGVQYHYIGPVPAAEQEQA